MKLADVVAGRPDFIMADSCVAGGTGPRAAVGVCGPSSTCATKVSWHHSPGEPTGVGEGREPHSQFCAILSELACLLAYHTISW
jgi:hypothetical protein